VLSFEPAVANRQISVSDGYACTAECRCASCGLLVSRASGASRLEAIAGAIALAYRIYAEPGRQWRDLTIIVEYSESAQC
jgi:hypothetical protein